MGSAMPAVVEELDGTAQEWCQPEQNGIIEGKDPRTAVSEFLGIVLGCETQGLIARGGASGFFKAGKDATERSVAASGKAPLVQMFKNRAKYGPGFQARRPIHPTGFCGVVHDLTLSRMPALSHF